MKPSEILSAAADLIEPPERFSREYTALRRDETARDPDATINTYGSNPKAIAWGGMGAIFAIGRRAKKTDAECYAVASIAARAASVEYFSDWLWRMPRPRAGGDVVSMLRGAAELARSEGQ